MNIYREKSQNAKKLLIITSLKEVLSRESIPYLCNILSLIHYELVYIFRIQLTSKLFSNLITRTNIDRYYIRYVNKYN